MVITELEIKNFRNITAAKFELSPNLNVFCGRNGSGKTSLLEAIFLLTHGRSFRTRKIDRVIQQQSQQLLVRGTLSSNSQPTLVMATERTLEGKARFKIANDEVKNAAELTRNYPLLLINPDSYRILELGPKYRRQFIDWGLFHVEQKFYELWQRYHRILKQRNEGLRQRLPSACLSAWDQEFVATAQAMDQLRQQYLKAYQVEFKQILQEILPLKEVSLHYQRGWAQESDLSERLTQSLSRDYDVGYTSYGPHRADLMIKVGAHQAHEVLSRGQQKLLIFVLRLAQGKLLQSMTNKPCGYLVDDLPAELDRPHQGIIMDLLYRQGFQVLVTGVDDQPFGKILENRSHNMFHVEHGTVKKWYNAATFEQNSIEEVVI